MNLFPRIFIIEDNTNNGRNPSSCSFLVIAFIHEETIGCINEEAMGATNEAAVGGIFCLTYLTF